MGKKIQLKGCISELNFGYDAKNRGIGELKFRYTKLGEMQEDNT